MLSGKSYKRKNRIELLEDMGCRREGRKYICANCEVVKTSRPAPKNAQDVSSNHFLPHAIEKSDGEWVSKCTLPNE